MDRSKSDSLTLLRLYRAVERWKALGPLPPEDPVPQAGQGGGAVHTRDVLPLLPRNLRQTRVRDLLPVFFSEGTPLDASAAGGNRERLPPDWEDFLAAARSRPRSLAGGRKCLVHLRPHGGDAIYFIAFPDLRPGEEPLPEPREISISASGISFPANRPHLVGDRIGLCYFPPHAPLPPLQLTGTVVRPGRPDPGGGFLTPVRFEDTTEEARERILDYVATRLRVRNLARAYRLPD